ncbi:Kinase, NAK [Spironucleus salmonicida]|nr:Kinase, NAK [Spironucleus salmonicida]
MNKVMFCGGYAQIYSTNHKQLVVRTFIVPTLCHIEQAETEFQIQHQLSEYFVIKLYHQIIEQERVFQVLEKAHQVTLTTKNFTIQAAKIIEYLHQNNIIHRDIKYENFIQLDNLLKICDFSSATTKTYTKEDLLNNNIRNQLQNEIELCTTEDYLPPEYINLLSGQNLTEKADVFTFGVMIYFLLFGQKPFENKQAASNGKYKLPKQVDEMYFSLLEMSLRKNQSERSSMTEILKILK